MQNAVRRRSFIRDLAAFGGTLPLVASWAQQAAPARPTRIGFLLGQGYPELEASFREELSRLGYTDGKNILIEARISRPNTQDLPTMTAELARMDLGLIVAGALPFALEVRKLNPSMPMVIATCPGMVSNGFAQTLERPGGIYTGMDELPPGVTARRLTLLKTAAPAVTRVALLSTTPGRGGHEAQVADAETTASALGVEVHPYRAASYAELKAALHRIGTEGMNGLLNFQGGLSLANRQLIVDFAAERRIPSIYQATLFAEAGGLMAWAPDLLEQYREAARFVDRIVKGAKPGDLPVKQPEKYSLTVNAGAARRIGLTLPRELLAQADRVLD
jgi:putative tryptophan/tyrosine transport system substrate-binding protein